LAVDELATSSAMPEPLDPSEPDPDPEPDPGGQLAEPDSLPEALPDAEPLADADPDAAPLADADGSQSPMLRTPPPSSSPHAAASVTSANDKAVAVRIG
jgi:hypothetical protein